MRCNCGLDGKSKAKLLIMMMCLLIEGVLHRSNKIVSTALVTAITTDDDTLFPVIAITTDKKYFNFN